MSNIDRSLLQEQFVQRIVDGMGTDELAAMAMDYLDDQYDDLTDEQLMFQVGETYPDLLEN